MPRPKDTLDRLNINTPCTADWDEMVGNDQVRFCRHCDLSVHNLSAMTRQEALRIVVNSKGKLCVRYIRRPDDSIHTRDMVIPKLHAIKRRASRLAAGAFSAALSVSTSLVAAAPVRTNSNAESQVESSLLANSATSSSFGLSGASVKGVVTDVNGAVIPGATVTLVNDANGLEQMTTTDGEGFFLLENLEQGSFTLRIAADGFNDKERSDINVSASGEETFDMTLDVEGTGPVMMGAMRIVTPENPLVAAVFDGDIVTVKELLARGTDVDSVDEMYGTALAQAVATGNLEIVDVLINAGADVNMKYRGGQTAIMVTSEQTTSEIVWALIDAGAKTDFRDEDGKSALHFAAGYANPGALRALLDAGASVDARDGEGRTALMMAAGPGITDNVEILLKAGASVNLRDDDGTTALGLAIENDYSETVKVLKEFGATE